VHDEDEAIERRVIHALQSLGIAYTQIPIDPVYADTADFCAHYRFPIDHAGHTIICASKRAPKRYAACVVTATMRVDLQHTVRQFLGPARVSLASPGEMQALTGMMIGGVTPFALPEEVPIYIDERILHLSYLILGSGARSSKLKIAPESLRLVRNAHVISDLGVDPAAIAAR
jgi:prolyl-tRNA editing enzyme YbaK/EbsC (Cys-tRNA(Pro) deacylase)